MTGATYTQQRIPRAMSARYAGTCDECRGPIRPAQVIYWTPTPGRRGGIAVHDRCAGAGVLERIEVDRAQRGLEAYEAGALGEW